MLIKGVYLWLKIRYNASDAINDPWIKKYTSGNPVDKPIIQKALENMKNFRTS